MIEINDISKVFRTSEVETVALNHVSLNLSIPFFLDIYFDQCRNVHGSCKDCSM